MQDVLAQGWEKIFSLPQSPSADDVREYLRQIQSVSERFECDQLGVRLCTTEPLEQGGERVDVVLQASPLHSSRSTMAVIVRANLTRIPKGDGRPTEFSFDHLSIGVLPKVQGRVTTRGHGIDVTRSSYESAHFTPPTRFRIPGFPVRWRQELRSCVSAQVADYLYEQLRQAR